MIPEDSQSVDGSVGDSLQTLTVPGSGGGIHDEAVRQPPVAKPKSVRESLWRVGRKGPVEEREAPEEVELKDWGVRAMQE